MTENINSIVDEWSDEMDDDNWYNRRDKLKATLNKFIEEKITKFFKGQIIPNPINDNIYNDFDLMGDYEFIERELKQAILGNLEKGDGQ